MEIEKEREAPIGIMAANLERSYEDFEPFCQWQRGQGRDILEIHLQGFKKEHLRVQINNYGILTISGEQPISDAKINRFRKEIKVSKELNPPQIHAKFVRGILYITMQSGSSQVKESIETLKNEKNKHNTCGSGSCVGGDNMLRFQISKKIAVSIAVVVAVGTVVGGFLIAWKCSKVPAPIIY